MIVAQWAMNLILIFKDIRIGPDLILQSPTWARALCLRVLSSPNILWIFKFQKCMISTIFRYKYYNIAIELCEIRLDLARALVLFTSSPNLGLDPALKEIGLLHSCKAPHSELLTELSSRFSSRNEFFAISEAQV